MGDGAEHLQAWKHFRLVALLASIPIFALSPISAVAVPVGYYLGLICDPDWDLISITSAEARMIRTVILIPLVGWTTLYAKIIHKHRSFWSHTPVIGTLIRLCWMLFPFVILLWYCKILPNSYTPEIFLGMWMGLSMADFVHWWKDR